MLVLRNGSNVMAEGGKPLINNEVNALRIENTDRITIGFVTTGPIAISWGDDTTLNVSTQTTLYSASKLYASIGNWNIIITGVENVEGIYFYPWNNYGNADKINTSVFWLSQFTNLQSLSLYSASFSGELSSVITGLKHLTSLDVFYTSTTSITFDVDKCQEFWSRCKRIFAYTSSSYVSVLKGSFSNINMNEDCEFILFDQQNIVGDINGILKSTYTKLTYLTLRCANGRSLTFNRNIDDITIPDTLTNIDLTNVLLGTMKTFDFKNLTSYASQCGYTSIDLSSNASFDRFASRCSSFYISFAGNSTINVPLSKFTSQNIMSLALMCNDGYNTSSGDITNLTRNFIDDNSASLIIQGGKNAADITGTVDVPNYKAKYLILDNCDVILSGAQIKELCTKCTIQLRNMFNVTGDMSGAVLTTSYPAFNHSFTSLPNLYGDVTTITFSGLYENNYRSLLYFYDCPNITGNLENLPLWTNKSSICIAHCGCTGISAFVRKVFANRNTCLKAAGGMTAISVQGNVDNASLTGTYQQPNLGTYTGNMNDLTEAQIDNLANGLNYTGTGTNTAWTDKEKIWFMVNCKNSSTDTSLRYRVTINY